MEQVEVVELRAAFDLDESRRIGIFLGRRQRDFQAEKRLLDRRVTPAGKMTAMTIGDIAQRQGQILTPYRHRFDLQVEQGFGGYRRT